MCKNSVETEWVYIIKSGSCRVLKSLFETKPDVQGVHYQEYSPDVKAIKGIQSIFLGNCVQCGLLYMAHCTRKIIVSRFPCSLLGFNPEKENSGHKHITDQSEVKI